ncbi:Mu-like prophage FluMu protein gp29 [Aeromonas hydrophila]|uniref:DUF935 domain-containing protein n=1 Tax=Aeromonas hydrophila TaxID=644 RepID=UPI000538FC2D|nr:DUF935 domain-containing protein [Aeromonas hydrophila]KHA57138.1 Mu-like prophage FluMu protein gp29 [Aeromonas hydrophila]
MGRIVDIHGNQLMPQTLEATQTASMLHLHRTYGEHPSKGLTPPKLSSILEQAEVGDIEAQCELFQDMEEKDAHLLAEMGKRRRALTTVPWSVEPARNPTAAEKAEAAWLNEVLGDMADFEDVLFDIMDAVGKGFSAQEIEWQRLGSEWIPKAFHYRESSWFKFDTDTRTELRLRDGSVDGAELQPFGWLVHTHKAKSGYVARGGIYRVLAWPFLFKNYSVRDLAEFLEIYGIPLRLGTFHKGATEDEKRILMRAVMNIGHSAAGVVPEGMQIDFKEAAKGTHQPFDWMVNWCEKSMSKAILGGTLTSQADGKTSTNALGNVHNEVRHDLLRSDAKQVSGALRQYLLYPLLMLNKGGDRDPRRLPRFTFDVVDPADFATYSKALPHLVSAGMRVPEQWVHDKLRIPVPAKGEAVLGAPAAQAATRQQIRVAAAKTAAEVDPLEDLAEQMSEEWEPVADMVEGPLQALLASCKNLAEFERRLPELIGQMDETELANAIAQGLFTAKVAGKVGAA